MSTLEIPAARLHALTWGTTRPEAPLAVLLHGFPDIPHSWEPVALRLAERGYRVVAPYMPGYHPSAPPERGDFLEVSDRILALVDALSPWRPVYLVGHDWGAAVSYVLLARAPERFRAACTMAVPHIQAFVRNGLGNPRQLWRSRYMAFFQLVPVADALVPRDDYAFIRKLWRDWSPGYSLPEAHFAELRECFDASMPAPLAWYRPQSGAMGARLRDLPTILGLLTRPLLVPTLYLHGEDDGCIGVSVTLGQRRYFAGDFEDDVIASAGHFLQLEQPVRVATRVLDFFARYPLSALGA
jgi:pimeloyl-ACP methyl ester carboxylesterase